MKKNILSVYQKEQFNPGLLGLFINPFYIARKGLYKNVSEMIQHLNGRILDIGCGSKPYEHLCNATEYVGLEIDSPEKRRKTAADYFYDGEKMPFEDKSFDNLIANQVFEHVFNPSYFLKEGNRILKIGGKFLMTVPFVWDEHEQPYDYARYSSFGLKHIFKENGFKIVEHRKINDGIEVIFQLINDYIYKVTLTKNPYLNLLAGFIFMSPFNIAGIVLAKILPRNKDLYLDNIILAEKVRDI